MRSLNGLRHSILCLALAWFLIPLAQAQSVLADKASRKPARTSVLKKATALLEKNQTEEALPFFREAVRKNPRSAEAYGGLGWCLFSLGKKEEALKLLKKAVALDPRNANAHHFLGHAYIGLGNRREAAREYRKAIKLDPSKHCNCPFMNMLFEQFPEEGNKSTRQGNNVSSIPGQVSAE